MDNTEIDIDNLIKIFFYVLLVFLPSIDIKLKTFESTHRLT